MAPYPLEKTPERHQASSNYPFGKCYSTESIWRPYHIKIHFRAWLMRLRPRVKVLWRGKNLFYKYGPKHLVKSWEVRVNELVESFLLLTPKECHYIYLRTCPSSYRGLRFSRGSVYPVFDNDEFLLSECGFLVHPPSYELAVYTKDPSFLAELEQVVDYLLFFHGNVEVFDVRHPVDPNKTMSTFVKTFFVEHNFQLPRIGIAAHQQDKIEILMGADILNAERTKTMILESLQRRQSHKLCKKTVTQGAERHSWFYDMVLRGGDVWLLNPEAATWDEWMKLLSVIANTPSEYDFGLDARFTLISTHISRLLTKAPN